MRDIYENPRNEYQRLVNAWQRKHPQYAKEMVVQRANILWKEIKNNSKKGVKKVNVAITEITMEKTVRKTGGHVDDLVLALIDAAYDKKADVRTDMTTALHSLGCKQPELVLSSGNVYLMKHQKLVQGHRVLLLDIMTRIIKDAASNISLDLAKELIQLASNELTKSKDIIPEWQTAASNVLVALGKHFSQEVMIEMLQKIVPGTLPHYFVILTLANLAKENVFGVVPFLKDIFSRMLSMLGMAKADNIRWVLATCIGAFSEAILDYCANIESAPYPDIAKDRFYGEIFTAFEIMFNVWLTGSKEARVRLATVEAFGYMTHLISKEKLEENINRLLQGITSLYKRHSEHYIITQSLCMVLSAASSDNSLMLLPYLETVMIGLHIQACIEPDYNNIQSVKNNNELLRCFQVLTQSFSDRVVGFLQQKLEGGGEKSKAATISVYKHLVNSSDTYLENKKELILSSVSIVLHENNLKVCRSFAQCIIAMAHHDYLGLEGGQKMVEFIVRMCALADDEKLAQRRTPDGDVVTSSSVRSMCHNVLHLMSTTVKIMEDVLWPYLLEFLPQQQYTEALMPLCRALGSIASKKREEEDEHFMIDHIVSVNVPKPQTLLSRLIIITGHPLKGNGRGIHILNFLRAYSPNIHPSIVDMWDTVIPKLTVYLEENSYDADSWNQKAWEDLILKLLAKTLSEVDSEEWYLLLGREIGLQIPLYNDQHEEKNFLYKCLGVVLRKIGTTDFIREHLNLIFSSVDHTNQIEREGCAVGVGFCAASHLDQCLMKLEEITKTQMVRKATGFMGLMKVRIYPAGKSMFKVGKLTLEQCSYAFADWVRTPSLTSEQFNVCNVLQEKGTSQDVDVKNQDKSEAEVDRVKSTVMLCYGYVVFYAPPSLICSRLESNVLRVINPHFSSVRDTNVKQNLIRAVELIGRAVQPGHIQREDFVFTRRVDLLKHMENFLKSESKQTVSETRSLAIDAITNLIKLEESISEEESQEIITTCTSNVYCVNATPTQVSSPIKKDIPVVNEAENERIMQLAVDSLNNLIKEISSKQPSPQNLLVILKYLEPYLNSVHNYERDRVVSTIKIVLENYLNIVNFNGGSQFSTLGYILGRLLPRCTDPVMTIRQNSMQCVQVLLTINDRYEGVPLNANDERIQALSQLRETLSKSEPSVLFNVVNELSMVISKKTPDEQVKTLVFSLIDGLKEVHSQSSSGACAILNCLMKFRGGELSKEVHSIVHDIVSNLSVVTFQQTITGSLVALRTLATHHLIHVLQSFLEFPVPFTSTVCEFWKTLAKDKDLTLDTLEHLLDLLRRTPPYTEVEDKLTTVRYANPLPVAISAALTEIFKVPETEALVSSLFPKLLSAILLQLGSCLGVKPTQNVTEQKSKKSKEPVNIRMPPMLLSILCFKQFINRCNLTAMQQHLNEQDVWGLLEDETTFCDGLQKTVIALCQCQPTAIGDVVSSLIPSLSSPYDIQRLVPAAVFAELINQRCCGDMQLVELLMNSLLSKLLDPAHLVRRLCIRGLGNVASVGGQKLQTYATTILGAMMAGMDDKEDPDMAITLEAMAGLSRILSLLDESAVRQILINICLRIRPCFEKENAAVRAAAIELFGNLAKFGLGPSEASFFEQIHTNFVSILLHLNEELVVTKACKVSLRLIGPRLSSTAINDMFQKHLIEDGQLHYGEFMNDLSRLMISDYSDKINFYVMACVSFFKSNWEDIRANAALFVGFLLGNLKKEDRSMVALEHVCSALVVLLKDPSATVRSRASEAMSLLYDY